MVARQSAEATHVTHAIARNGFEVPLVRIGPNRWRGTVRFRSTGRWRVVVPNGAPAGVVISAGVARLMLAVH